MTLYKNECIARKIENDFRNVEFSPLCIRIEAYNEWHKIDEQEKLEIFPNKGTIHGSVAKKSENEYKETDTNEFFLVEYEDSITYKQEDSRSCKKYATKWNALLPVVDLPEFCDNSFEYTRFNLKNISILYKKFYLKIKNEKYIIVNNINNNYEINVKTNDPISAEVYTIQTNDIIDSGDVCLCKVSSIDNNVIFLCGDDVRFLQRVITRVKQLKNNDLYQIELDTVLRGIKNGEITFEEIFSKYDMQSIQERLKNIELNIIDNNEIYRAFRSIFSEFDLFHDKIEQDKMFLHSKFNEFCESIISHEDLYKLIDVFSATSVGKQEIDIKIEEFVKLKQIESLEIIEKEHDELCKQLDTYKLEVERYENKFILLRNVLHEEILLFQKTLTQVSPAEIPYARTFSERLQSVLEPDTIPKFPSVIAPWSNVQGVTLTKPISSKHINSMLGCCFDELGLKDIKTFFALDWCVRNKKLPLLFGKGRHIWGRLYAHLLTGGKLCYMQADPTVFSIDDLWRVAGSQVPTALALAWEEVKVLHKPILLQVDIEESPCHLWISQFENIVSSSICPPNLWPVLTVGHLCDSTQLTDIEDCTPIFCPDLTCIEYNVESYYLSDITYSPELTDDIKEILDTSKNAFSELFFRRRM